MVAIQDNEEEWERKRGKSLLVFSLIFFINGITLTIYQPTEFFYFRDTMQLKRADIYFGLSQGVMFGSGLIFSFFGNLYASRIKRVKLNFMCVDVLCAFGNMLYVLHYHPSIVLVGQLLIGSGALRHILALSELSKIYDADDVSKKTALLTLFTMLGGALGPCATFAAISVKSQIGWWKLDVNVMPGVFMGSLSIISFVVNLLFLDDLSFKKEKLDKLLDGPLGDRVKNSQGKEESNIKQYMKVLKLLLNNRTISALYLVTFLGFFARTWLILLTPIKSSHDPLNWIQFDIAEVLIVSIIAGSIPTTIISIIFYKRLNDTDVLLYSVFTLLVALVLMMCYPYLKAKTGAAAIMYLVNVFAISSGAAANISVRFVLTLPIRISHLCLIKRNAAGAWAYTLVGLHTGTGTRGRLYTGITKAAMLTRMVAPDIKGISETIYNRLYDGSKMVAGFMVIVPVISLEIALIPLILFCVMEFIWVLWNRTDVQDMKQIELPAIDVK